MGEIYANENSGSKNPKKYGELAFLDNFGKNITKLAEENKIDPVIGRTEEIKRVVQILGRRKKNNPVLIGNPGVGKTSIVEGLAALINSGDVPHALQNKLIYTLEISTLVAGTKYRGEFEERMKGLLDEIKNHPNVIIFIDEIHTMVGAGSTSGSLDASNIFKPALARGEIRCIGATTFDEYRENIESDGALGRRFQKVLVNPPSKEETNQILKNIKTTYEKHHNVSYTDEIIDLIVHLSDIHIKNRYFPDKAIDILDEVGSYKNLHGVTTPSNIIKMENKLVQAKKDKRDAVNVQDYEKAAQFRDKCNKIETELKQLVADWKRSIKDNLIPIEEDDVLKVISKLTNIPLEKMTQDQTEYLLNLETYLKEDVVGQDQAIEKITKTIQRNKVGIKRRSRTLGNFIFLGSTGVGKTSLAKSIAKRIFDGEDSMIRVDMSEFMERYSVSKLIGSAPGYIGYEEGGVLTEAVKNKPYSVVLFDEIEKAHPDVCNILLQILDEGYITDSLGQRIDFRNTLIIMTSNLGARKLEDFGAGIGFRKNAGAENKIISDSLKKHFPPEFLNRIDDIITFNKLNEDNISSILDREIKLLKESLNEIGPYKIKISKGVKDLVIKEGFNDKSGARGIQRTLEQLVENRISELILRGQVKKNDLISVKLDRKSNDILIETKNL